MPSSHKEEAKGLRAKWDWKARTWFAPKGEKALVDRCGPGYIYTLCVKRVQLPVLLSLLWALLEDTAGCAALLEDAAGCAALLEDAAGCTEAPTPLYIGVR